MGTILAVCSQKGGVGKTTTVVNLAAAFARRGLKTLVVDVDPQGSVRYGVGLRPGHPTLGFADYLQGRCGLREVILATSLPWLRVMLAGSVSEQDDHTHYNELVANSVTMAKLFADASQRCDVVVVDTPPGLGPVTRGVLGASDRALVPLQVEPLALQTTPQILRAIQGIAEAHPNLAFDGLLLTMYEAGNPAAERTLAYIRQHLPAGMVIDGTIPRSSALAEAFAAGQPAVLRSPADDASQAYVNLATRLAQRFAP